MFLSDPFWFVLIAIELLFLVPLVMYLAGKLMKVESEQFKFVNCVWIIFISGLISGFVSELHWIAGAAAFLLLVVFLLMKQFKASVLKAVVVSILAVGVGIGLQYLNPQMLSLINATNGDVEIGDEEEVVEIDMGEVFKEAEQKIAEKAAIVWTKYENSTYSFSFDYPDNWELTGKNDGVIVQNVKSSEVYGGEGDFWISFTPNVRDEGSLKEWFVKNIEYSTDEKVEQKLNGINAAAGDGYMTEKDIFVSDMEFTLNDKYPALVHRIEFQKPSAMEGPAYTYSTFYVMTGEDDNIYTFEVRTPTGDFAEDFNDLFWDVMETLEID